MVKPTQPKGIKPKAEISEVTISDSQAGGWGGKKLILVNTLITVIISTLFIGSNYLIVNYTVDAKLANLPLAGAQGEGEQNTEDPEEKPKKGIILDLGEFILNLSDPSTKRYLKVNVALELSRAETDPEIDASGGKSEGGHGGHGGGEDPLKKIEAEMNQYKPAIRDSIISVLSSKTAEELSSLPGKELSKEQIKEAINPIFGGEREVLRVSFGTFIIQ